MVITLISSKFFNGILVADFIFARKQLLLE